MERSNESIVAGLGTPLADVSPVMVDDSTAARPQSDRELDVVYIELDTLLDTRIGTISQHRPELAPKLLNSGKYSQRIIDRFGDISPEQFDALYAKRDIETLKHSLLTNLPFFLQRIIKDCIVHASMTKIDQELKYVINVFPYNFDDHELLEMLAACVRYHTLDTVAIEIVRIPPDKLTPSLIKEEYDIMIMYRYQEWLYMHREELDRVRCPAVTLVVPQLFYRELPDREVLAECRKLNKDPMAIAEEQLAGHIRLKTMDVSLFCIHETVNENTAADISLELLIQPEDIENHAAKRGATVVNEPLKKPTLEGEEDIML